MRPDQKKQPDFTLVIERVFDAPRQKVWKAWTDKKLIMQWLAPEGFAVTEHEGAVAAGEQHSHCMVSTENQESRYAGKYLEVKEPEKLVFSHVWLTDVCGIPGIETVCTVLLEETEDGRTKMIFTQSGISTADSRDSQNWGWNSSFDGLSDLMQTQQKKI